MVHKMRPGGKLDGILCRHYLPLPATFRIFKLTGITSDISLTMQVRASADLVETEATSALVSLVMKLSEFELRPLFLHLCEWKAAVSGDDPKAILGGLDRRLSFYRVLDGLATALKASFTTAFDIVLIAFPKASIPVFTRVARYCPLLTYFLIMWVPIRNPILISLFITRSDGSFRER